jgi:adenine-specific DNA-methyltransferase
LFERAYAQDAPKGRGAADLPRAPEHEQTVWPVPGSKKPNAIMRNAEIKRWLYPNGFYCVVSQFSSKEEKRCVVASVVDPAAFGDHTVLGFENHINLFHEN